MIIFGLILIDIDRINTIKNKYFRIKNWVNTVGGDNNISGIALQFLVLTIVNIPDMT